VTLWLWVVACGAQGTPEPLGLISPVDGLVTTTPWVPVQFEIRRGEQQEPAALWLDGVDVTDPLGFSRRRANKWGGYADHLSTLDLRDVAPGEHLLEVQVGERSGSARFTHAPAACRVDAWITDPDGEPLAGRVIVLYEGHRVVVGSPETAVDPRGRDAALDAFYVLPERGGSVFLPCRTYELVAVGDLRREVDRQTVSLVEGQVSQVDFVLPVAVETPGEHTADLHVHTGRSADAFLPDQPRVESLAAAGLEVVVVTDHDFVTELGPSFQAVLGDAGPVVIEGVERDLKLWNDEKDKHKNAGHWNAFPLGVDDVLPLQKHDVVETFLGQWDALTAPTPSGRPVVQLNHPRGLHFQEVEEVEVNGWALFSYLGFSPRVVPGEGPNAWMGGVDPETGVGALGFDTLEVMNRSSLALFREVRADWFALLGHGVRFTGTGNSDTHGLVIEAPGFPVNLVEAPLPVDESSLAEWLAAVVDGRVRVSTGPVVGLEVVDGVARVRVQAASWVPVHQVRVVVNGREDVVVLDPVADGDGLFGATDVIHEFPLALDRDSWVVAEAGWPLTCARDPALLGLYAHVAPGHVPIGFTNPVFVDHDGDGEWTAPGPR